MYLAISTSLNHSSSSRQVAARVVERLQALGAAARLLNLANHKLPLHDGSPMDASGVDEIREQVGAASGIVLVVPIYFGDPAVSARNLLHAVGDAWRRKVVGFACIAGDRMHHGGAMSLANWLMLEHRAFILPDFVFTEQSLVSASLRDDGSKLNGQIRKLAENLRRVTESLRSA